MSLANQVILVTGGTGSFGKKFIHTVLEQHKPAKQKTCGRHHQECGEDAIYAARIEFDETEIVPFQVVKDDRRDQKPGNNEENIHADEAALDPQRKCVKANYRQNSDSTQPVDVRAVFWVG